MGSIGTIELAPVLKRLRAGASYDDKRLSCAFAIATSAYGDAEHWTGESLINHTLGIVEELAPFEPDEDAVIACLLHHVLEKKAMTLVELETEFGSKVRSLVSGVHLLSHVTLEGRRRSIEDLRIMLISVSDDIRILFICLCDRVHCLKFVDRAEPDRAKRLCQDVLQLFAPVASRLGIYTLKHKLEDSAFPVVYPNDSERVMNQLRHVHSDYPHFFEKAADMLITFLSEQGIQATVDAREKQPFSIFQKMHKKSITSIKDIHDLFAFRVIVPTEEDCYQVLGLLHRLGRPFPNRFKDYIAFPKPNGYQSLHTTLAGLADFPDSFCIEVQIRTASMHREAQYGVAAHWSYKEHGATEHAMEHVQLHSMLLHQEQVDDETQCPTFADHIFVLTPKGDIVELPESATPLDFAFQVHTDLGLSFRNARVNGSIVPLDYTLENGDVVEIQKHARPQPSSQWMQMLKMGSSRSKLRRYLYAQDRPHLITMGKELVNAELRKRDLPLLTTDLSFLRIVDAEHLTHQQRGDVLMKIGQGAEKAASLMGRVPHIHDHQQKETTEEPPAGRLRSGHEHIGIEGNLAMPLRYAKCCAAEEWPREAIVGNINRLGEVMIHRRGCHMFQNTNPARRVQVWWK